MHKCLDVKCYLVQANTQLAARRASGSEPDLRRIYRRGFRDLELCVIFALGYAHLWGKG